MTRRSSSMPSPVRAEVASRGTSPSPSCSSRRRTSASIGSRPSFATSSMWLSTTSITSRWLARGARKRWWTARSAYFCGSSTHTIRSVSPTSRSTSRWCATSVESWSGRSSSTSPSSPLCWWPWSSVESRTTRWRGGISSQSSRPAAGSSPQTQAVAYDVVGRRTPTAARSRPARALNVDDLPEPVAPASATTVCSAESRSRAPARSTTRAAWSTTESSSRPRAPATACSRPTRRVSSEAPRPRSFFAPATSPLTTPASARGAGRRPGGPASAAAPASPRAGRGRRAGSRSAGAPGPAARPPAW